MREGVEEKDITVLLDVRSATGFTSIAPHFFVYARAARRACLWWIKKEEGITAERFGEKPRSRDDAIIFGEK